MLGARLLVQCVMGLSAPQLGMDDATLFAAPQGASERRFACGEELTTPHFSDHVAASAGAIPKAPGGNSTSGFDWYSRSRLSKFLG